jgi:hypothetical protein
MIVEPVAAVTTRPPASPIPLFRVMSLNPPPPMPLLRRRVVILRYLPLVTAVDEQLLPP